MIAALMGLAGWVVKGRWTLLCTQFSESPSTRSADTKRLHEKLATRRQWVQDYCLETQNMLDWLMEKCRAPFSFRAFEISLCFALIYPVAFALLVWGISGAALQLGDTNFLVAHVIWWKRLLMIAGLAWFFWSICYREATTWDIVGYPVVFAALGSMGNTGFCSIVFTIACCLYFSIEYKISIIVSVVCYSLFSIMIIPFRIWLGPISIGGYHLGIDFTEAIAIATNFILFVFFLPFLNALWDWLSLGITRQLLRWNLQRHLRRPAWRHILKGTFLPLLDLLAACMCLVGLLGSTVFCISAAHRLYVLLLGGMGGFFSLAEVFTPLQVGDYGNPTLFWVYGMLVSTWVPSIVHGWIALRVMVNRGMANRYANFAARMDEVHSNGENYYDNESARCGVDAAVYLVCSYGLPTVLVLGLSSVTGYVLLVQCDGLTWLIQFARSCALWGI